MLDVAVIEEAAAAVVTLDPKRARLLSELVEPASAATLAARLGLPRQKVNYHLRALEKHGLVRVAEERRWGGLTERLLVATARSYVVSPAALGPVASDPERTHDRLSASYLIALAARIVREGSALLRRSAETGKRLATLSIDTEIRFRSPKARARFSEELVAADFRTGPAPSRRFRPRRTAPPPGGRRPSRAGGSIRPGGTTMSIKHDPPCHRSIQAEAEVPRLPGGKSGRPSPPAPASRRGSIRRMSRRGSAERSGTTPTRRWTTSPRK